MRSAKRPPLRSMIGVAVMGRSSRDPCSFGWPQLQLVSNAVIDYNSLVQQYQAFPMATLTIRNLDQAVKERLRVRAAEHGHSMEAEARRILQTAHW